MLYARSRYRLRLSFSASTRTRVAASCGRPFLAGDLSRHGIEIFFFFLPIVVSADCPISLHGSTLYLGLDAACSSRGAPMQDICVSTHVRSCVWKATDINACRPVLLPTCPRPPLRHAAASRRRAPSAAEPSRLRSRTTARPPRRSTRPDPERRLVRLCSRFRQLAAPWVTSCATGWRQS